MKILILFLQFSCCGVNNYKDWQNQTYIIEQDNGKVPDSCCFNVKNMTQCLNNPGDQEYADHMNGCLDTFAKSIEGNKNIVVYVSAGMILGMVSILIFSYFAQWVEYPLLLLLSYSLSYS